MWIKRILCLCFLFLLQQNLPGQGQSRPDTLWTTELNLPQNENLACAIQTADGQFLFGGQEQSNYGLWLAKTDADFDTIWQSILWEWQSSTVLDILSLSDTNYMAIVQNYSYLCALIKFNGQGDTLWTKKYGSVDGNKIGYALTLMPDDGFLIAGETTLNSAGSNDVWVMRVDMSGNMIWEKTYGGTQDDRARNIIALQDGNYLIIGSTSSFGQNTPDLYLLKINAQGDTAWTKYYSWPTYDSGVEGYETAEGHIIIAGNGLSGNTSRAWLYKLNPDGSEIWKKSISDAHQSDKISALQITRDGGYLIGGAVHHGQNPTSFWLLKADTSGKEQWSWEITPGSGSGGRAVFQTPDGAYVLAGNYYSPKENGLEVWLIKVENDSALLGIQPLPAGTQGTYRLQQNFPNPFNPLTTIEFTLEQAGKARLDVYDILGKKVATVIDQHMPAGQYSYRFDGRMLTSGIYYYRLTTAGFTDVQKMVLLR